MAEGILRIAVVSLAGAIKEVSVMRGIDPRDFALLAYGGAGPLHAAADRRRARHADGGGSAAARQLLGTRPADRRYAP